MIEQSWINQTWNPIIGCDKYSDGCQNCYAHDIALRLQRQGDKNYQNGFELTFLPCRLRAPYSWRKPRKVFVNSMSDLFHKDLPFDVLKQIFDVMNNCPQHLFQIFTKRSENLALLASKLNWSNNIMMGVTIEADKYRYRLENLKKVPAKYKFVILEPLLSPIQKLDLSGIDWVIVGGESGKNARPMDIKWVEEIKNWTIEQKVAFWFKQTSSFGGIQKPALIDGKSFCQEPRIKLEKDLFDF